MGTIMSGYLCDAPGGSCSGTALDTVVEFDKSGKILRSWGAGLFNQAHSLDVDKDGNIRLVDSQVRDGKGSQVFKFTPDGKLLMTLGKAGVAGRWSGRVQSTECCQNRPE
jgi:hypothetical protein